MSPHTIQLVQESFSKIAPNAPQVASLFYSNLFTLDPSLKPLFKGNIEEQGKKLMQMIDVAVRKLTDLDTLVPVLQNLARRHVGYGVKNEHYATVGAALLKTLSDGLGSTFTLELKSAWTDVYTLMAKTMMDAANEELAMSQQVDYQVA